MMRRLIVTLGFMLASAGFFNAHAAFELGTGICETSTTTGVGTLNLAGAYTAGTDYLSFLSQIVSTNSVPYTIESSDGKFEHGVGVFTDATPDTLSRASDIYSSDGVGTKLTLPAGTHIVCLQTGSDDALDDEDKGDITTTGGFRTWTVDADSIALTTDTTGNYAAGDAEAGAATTGDSATSFFSTGTIEAARLPAASETATGIVELATTAEAVTGTDTTRAVTAAGVAAVVNVITFVNQTFTASGTYTPTSGMQSVTIRCQAPGGGGGGSDGVGVATYGVASGGGGGGEYAEGTFSAATIGASKTVTIGAVGGAGAGTGATGGTGGTTSVVGVITTIGGTGGTGTGSDSTATETVRAGGAGGTGGTGGSFRVPGGAGGTATQFEVEIDNKVAAEPDVAPGSIAIGGGSVLGPATLHSVGFDQYADVAGQVGRDYGAGGTGSYDNDTTGSAGGAGGAGMCTMDELIGN